MQTNTKLRRTSIIAFFIDYKYSSKYISKHAGILNKFTVIESPSAPSTSMSCGLKW